MDIKIFKFQQHGDYRGQLVSIEETIDIPFQIKRVYYMYDTIHNAIRGLHAHKSLEQVLICIHGSCKIRLDDGKEKEVIELNSPNEGIYIKNTIWREMYDFSSDAVLMCLASEKYNENDYIRNYEDFISTIAEKEITK